MTLCDWIKKTGAKKVARLLNVDPSTVSLWRNGRSTPRPKTMQKIIKITKGKVDYRGILESAAG
jgi:DNA-binding transcriptional regulator YdaS (Cro superfamily)